jgi:integrase
MKPTNLQAPVNSGLGDAAHGGGVVIDFTAYKVAREAAQTGTIALLPEPSPLALARHLWGDVRMDLTNEALIAEAVACNHKQLKTRRTRHEYETILSHWAVFLDGHAATFYTAQRKHVLLFLSHMEEPGGGVSRLCDWCSGRGCPTGRKQQAYSASYRKKFLCALRFLYWHFASDETLPNLDPTAAVKSPRVEIEHQYTPTREEVQALLAAPGQERDRLLAHLLYYAPTRREPVSRMRWRDVDLTEGVWRLVGLSTPVAWSRYALPRPDPPRLARSTRRQRWRRVTSANCLADPSAANVPASQIRLRVSAVSSSNTVTRYDGG